MGKIRRSWLLTKAALRLIGRNPALVLFPMASLAVFVGVMVLVMAGGRLVSGVHFMPVREFFEQAKLHWGYFVPAVAVGAFVANFAGILSQAALIGCVLLQMEGKPHGLFDGLRLAWSRRGAIVKWTLVMLTIGIVLQGVERQFNRVPGVGPWVGRWVFRLVGASWTLVTFLVVPVMVFEEQPGVWAQLRRSGQLFKRSWGEQVVGRGMITAPLAILMGGLFAILFILVTVGGHAGAGAIVGVGIMLTVLVLSPLMTAVYGTYVAVLYGYTVTGMLPEEFSADLLPARTEGQA